MSSNSGNDAKNDERTVLDELRERFSEKYINHLTRPRNPGPMDNPDGHGRTESDCGDTLELFFRVKNERIVEARFTVRGCATTLACGSAAVELTTGREVTEAASITADDVNEVLGGLPEANEHCAVQACRTIRETVRDYFATRNESWKRLYRRDR